MHFLITAFTAVACASRALAQCVIDTPSPPRQCTSAVIEWQDCALPVALEVLSPQTGTALDGPFTVDNTAFAWLARLPAGTNVVFQLIDANGDVADSGIITIRPGPTDC